MLRSAVLFLASLALAAAPTSVQFHSAYRVKAPFVPVAGAQDPADFRVALVGPRILMTVPDLPAGPYQVELPLAETGAPGEHVVDLLCGRKTLASGLDPVRAAGGSGRAFTFRAAFTHPGGLFRIGLVGRQGEARFYALRILRADGGIAAGITAWEESMACAAAVDQAAEVPGAAWRDPSRPARERARDLVGRMTLREKAEQLVHHAPALPRLGVQGYCYANEALHGICGNGRATSFPQCIGMAATWDMPLVKAMGQVIATEARAKYEEAVALGRPDLDHACLSFWCPNLNLVRDPRWGRGQESYGEDPFLLGRCGVAMITGLQGDDPDHPKAIASPKHFAVHSGPEPDRHRFDVAPPERDLYETYLPQFEAAIREGRAGSIMGAYQRLYGVPCNGSTFLLQDLLRDRWGFQGFVVSDCGAIADFWQQGTHELDLDPLEAAVRSLKAGCDNECAGCEGPSCAGGFDLLFQAVRYGLVEGRLLDQAVERCFEARFRLGLFDAAGPSTFPPTPATVIECPAHAAQALKAAREAMTLLRNEGGLLPLPPTLRSLAVIGPNADAEGMLLANYNGEPTHRVTILQGLRTRLGADRVVYTKGCDYVGTHETPLPLDPAEVDRAVALARNADAVVFVGGISASLEGEEGAGDWLTGAVGFEGGDRTAIELPQVQTELLKRLQATGRPIVLVLCCGSALALPWEAEHVPAILCAWYPGQDGGTAVAETLFGDVAPAGRLPVTFYRATSDLPPFRDYSMRGRTYRYFGGPVQWPFGHGLSYTSFRYQGAALSAPWGKAGGTVTVSVQVTNSGARDGDEVVQVYARDSFSPEPRPSQRLVGFTRVAISRGATRTVEIPVRLDDLRYWDPDAKAYVVRAGAYDFRVGASAADIRATVPFVIR